MEKYDIYKDIAERTEGDIYVGVVGPARTGKSTFISKFMENLVLPNISAKLHKQIATDEMPQAAEGKTIMTTEPKFVPSSAVKIQLKNKTTAKIRLVDCVGYLFDGVLGHLEEDKPRLVQTPWSEEKISLEKAAEIGTTKVIREYSTIGVVITTDGSFGEIARENFVPAEERCVEELNKCNKPYVIILNSSDPLSDGSQRLAGQLEEKYGVSVLPVNCEQLKEDDVSAIMEKVLLEFPVSSVNVELPKWMRTLPQDNPIIKKVVDKVKNASKNLVKMRDYQVFSQSFEDDDDFEPIEINAMNLGNGILESGVSVKNDLFYKVLSSESQENITDEFDLMNFIKSFANEKREYVKVKDALKEAEENGYGIVLPTTQEMNLEEPVLVKQGGKFGVKLKASAPSLHIMKVDVQTEVAPIVGTEKQGEDLVNYLMSQFEDDPNGIWETNMFGKSLHELVNEGLSSKIVAMPKEAQNKMRKTLTKIVNENKGGIICILL